MSTTPRGLPASGHGAAAGGGHRRNGRDGERKCGALADGVEECRGIARSCVRRCGGLSGLCRGRGYATLPPSPLVEGAAAGVPLLVDGAELLVDEELSGELLELSADLLPSADAELGAFVP